MKNGLMLIILAASLLLAGQAFGKEDSGKKPPLFAWDLLWTGSWYKSFKVEEGEHPGSEELFDGGTLYNRGNLTLSLPAGDLSFRFLATDKRLLPLTEDDGKAGFNGGFGLYHRTSGSRFLYGIQNEYGLPARINNVWLRGAPFMESRSPLSRDFKNEPSAQDKDESYLYISLPPGILPGFSPSFSLAMDSGQNPALGGGIELGGKQASMRLDSFYTRRKLQPRKVSTWFSSSPPLPERDFDIFALAAILHSPIASFAADWAFSETFAWGRGVYGNFALSLGNKPWRFSLAGDAAGNRFADRSGNMAGAGFRASAKVERFWPRSGLFRLQGTFRSPGLEEDINRGAVSAYFRPSAPTAAERRKHPYMFRFSRASFSLSRDARTPAKTADSLNSLLAFNSGPFSTSLSCVLHSLSRLEEDGSVLPLFQSIVFEHFESFKVTGELGIKLKYADIKTRLGYTIREKKEPLWESGLNFSVRPGKWGRLSLNIASTDFPLKWNYTASWRLEYASKK